MKILYVLRDKDPGRTQKDQMALRLNWHSVRCMLEKWVSGGDSVFNFYLPAGLELDVKVIEGDPKVVSAMDVKVSYIGPDGKEITPESMGVEVEDGE